METGGPSGTSLLSRSKKSKKFDFKKTLHSYLPITEWLQHYEFKQWIVADLAGGLTLGCILVAQSLAHADLCKVKLINGPYSCMLPPVFYALFGTCVHSSVGTGGLVSLLTGEQLAQYGDLDSRSHAGAILTFQVGLILVLMGACQLSFLVRFLSRPALSGFITASALLIMYSQVPKMLGLPAGKKVTDIFPGERWTFQPDIVRKETMILSILVFLWLYYAKKAAKALEKIKPLKFLYITLKYAGDFKELVALIVTAAIMQKYSTEWNIDIVGKVPEGLPSFAIPFNINDSADRKLFKELIPGATLVALVVFLSSFAGAKKFALKDGYRVTALNELLALGAANLAGSLNQAVPTQIGLSRMGIAHGAGVKSQLGANVFVAIVVTLVVFFFAPFLFYVPRCVLNCIIVNGASHLTEWDQMKYLWGVARHGIHQGETGGDPHKYKTDFMVWMVSCLSTLYFGAFTGILVAVAMSLLLILYQVVHPNMTHLGWKQSNESWVHKDIHVDAVDLPGILVFRFEGPLFYANVERLQEWLEEMEEEYNDAQDEKNTDANDSQHLHGIIMSASAISFVDTTAIQCLQELLKAYKKRGVTFVIANSFGQAGRAFQSGLAKDEKGNDLLPADSINRFCHVEDCKKIIDKLQKMSFADASMSGSQAVRPLKRSFIQRKSVGKK